MLATHIGWIYTLLESQQVLTRGGGNSRGCRFTLLYKAYILGCIFGGTQTEICAFKFSGNGGWCDEAEFLENHPVGH